MKPVTFACHATLPHSPEEIAAQILDVSKWPGFQGYGLLPGIKSAYFENATPGIIGSRIRVTNMDGSNHVEEIVAWEPERRLVLRLGDFSKPLSSLATHFVETWQFERVGNGTSVTRCFAMHANSWSKKPALWLISFFLKRAIARHLRDIKES
jgi:hypothetical protein